MPRSYTRISSCAQIFSGWARHDHDFHRVGARWTCWNADIGLDPVCDGDVAELELGAMWYARKGAPNFAATPTLALRLPRRVAPGVCDDGYRCTYHCTYYCTWHCMGYSTTPHPARATVPPTPFSTMLAATVVDERLYAPLFRGRAFTAVQPLFVAGLFRRPCTATS